MYYGEDNAAIPAAQWNFGPLKLDLLDQGTLIALPVQTVTTGLTPVTAGTPVTLTLTAAVRTMTTGAAKAMAATARITRKGHK